MDVMDHILAVLSGMRLPRLSGPRERRLMRIPCHNRALSGTCSVIASACNQAVVPIPHHRRSQHGRIVAEKRPREELSGATPRALRRRVARAVGAMA